MHLIRSLFSFKRLRSTYLGREKIQQQQHQWPASFFFLSLFFGGNGAGEHAKGRVVTGIKDSHGFWIPRPGFRSLDSGFQTLVRFQILWAIFRIPKPRIPHFTRKNFPESGIQISPTWSEKRRRLRSRPSFAFFYDLWQCVEFYWLQAPLGISLSVYFLFLHSCARVLEISPFALLKPSACCASYNNLKRNQAIVSQIVF